LPEPQVGGVRVLGVDDFAVRRSHVYGSVLLDLDSRSPVELFEGRDAQPPLADWLAAHPRTELREEPAPMDKVEPHPPKPRNGRPAQHVCQHGAHVTSTVLQGSDPRYRIYGRHTDAVPGWADPPALGQVRPLVVWQPARA
jgi:hypothetical protein